MREMSEKVLPGGPWRKVLGKFKMRTLTLVASLFDIEQPSIETAPLAIKMPPPCTIIGNVKEMFMRKFKERSEGEHTQMINSHQ
jgi:hypothetical protein